MKPTITSENETHPRSDELLDEADRLLEHGDFAGSVAAFREAALLTPLSTDFLMNLMIAEDNERIEFRRRLTQMFPESLDYAVAEVEMLVQAGFRPQAVARCTGLIENPGLAPDQTFRIRHARFKLAKDARRDPGTLVADFVDLWNGPSYDLDRMRLMLLRALLGIKSPALLGALALIRDQFGEETGLMRIIDSKIEQLTFFQELESIGQTSQPTSIQGDEASKPERFANAHE